MTVRFGAFGKMPALGDFFRIDLAPGLVDPWDRWLQDGLVMARSALGGRWQDCYFSAPIWRFSLSPGLAGAAAVTGVMMMSVDRVGRQFPLTLAATLPDGTDPLLDHLVGGDTFAALEGVALDALEDGMTRERLAAQLAGVTRPDRAINPSGLRREPGGVVIQGPGDILPRIAAESLRATIRRGSVWSAEIDGETRMMVCEGLPAGGQLVGLFDLQARLWTGVDVPSDDLPPPAAPAPSVDPVDLHPASAPPPRATAAVASPGDHVPLDDPLADILVADDPMTGLVAETDDDPLAALLSDGEPEPASDPQPASLSDATQEP